jgi:hypothetical protein
MGLRVVELKPCPFCGSEDLDSESTNHTRYIRCQNCSASGGHSFDHEEDNCDHEEDNWSWETTISRWNKRVGVNYESKAVS